MFHDLFSALEETLFMVLASGLISVLVGCPLGILWAVTSKDHILPNPKLHQVLSFLFKISVSIPYLVFMLVLIPLSKKLMGPEMDGLTTLIPLSLAGIPLAAKSCCEAILTVPRGLIEMGASFCASGTQMVFKILIPESLQGIIKGITHTLVNLLGYSVIAGALGSPGLGFLALKKYNDAEMSSVFLIAILLMALVWLLEVCGNYIALGKFKNS